MTACFDQFHPSDRCFVSTAIPYVNAEPHLGHALEAVLADLIVRAFRRRCADVWFTSGTDDNSRKNVLAATLAGVSVKDWVREQSDRFATLLGQLDVAPDAFVRTSENAGHAAVVAEVWQRCAAAGDLYRGTYRGYYCVGCEQYFRRAELPKDGVCPEHGTPLSEVEEENTFFRLSKYASQVRELIAAEVLCVRPEAARAEVLAFLDTGVLDVSVSRPASGDESWGIAVPDQLGQVVWVWFDALCNYLSSVGFAERHSGVRYERYWETAARRVHVIGKGINRFHTVLWPAILLSAGLPLPTDVFVHGYLTVDGAKISKSAGNGVAPRGLVKHYGTDAVRYFLARHVNVAQDTDFTTQRFHAAYQAELVNTLGNTASRIITLCRRYPDVTWEDVTVDAELVAVQRGWRREVQLAEGDWHFGRALERIWATLGFVGQYLETRAPWRLDGSREARANAVTTIAGARYLLLEVADLLGVYLPSTATETSRRLRQLETNHLFPRVEYRNERWE